MHCSRPMSTRQRLGAGRFPSTVARYRKALCAYSLASSCAQTHLLRRISCATLYPLRLKIRCCDVHRAHTRPPSPLDPCRGSHGQHSPATFLSTNHRLQPRDKHQSSLLLSYLEHSSICFAPTPCVLKCARRGSIIGAVLAVLGWLRSHSCSGHASSGGGGGGRCLSRRQIVRCLSWHQGGDVGSGGLGRPHLLARSWGVQDIRRRESAIRRHACLAALYRVESPRSAIVQANSEAWAEGERTKEKKPKADADVPMRARSESGSQAKSGPNTQAGERPHGNGSRLARTSPSNSCEQLHQEAVPCLRSAHLRNGWGEISTAGLL